MDIKNALISSIFAILITASFMSCKKYHNEEAYTAVIAPTAATAPTSAPGGDDKPDQENEWFNFRNNEDQYKGSKVCWRFKVDLITVGDGNPWGYLDYNRDCGVEVTGSDGIPYRMIAGTQPYYPKVHGDDIITVNGAFVGVDERGDVIIEASNITNEGVIGRR